MTSVRWCCETGIPPIARKMYPKGKKNQVSFIRNPALNPADLTASSPTKKSQLLVCGAMQMTDLGTGGVFTTNRQPIILSMCPAKFKAEPD